MRKISCTLDRDSILNAVKQIKAEKKNIRAMADKLVMLLADEGVAVSAEVYSNAKYDGTNDITVKRVKSKKGYIVRAKGKAVLFIEFGSGTIGYGHPAASKLGMGPSTWSLGENGKGHWNDPPWYFAHGQKSVGNPPAMAMWKAEWKVRRKIKQAVMEVFR